MNSAAGNVSRNSLQKRLSVWLSAAILATGLLVTIISFFVAYDDAKEFQDQTLKQIAVLAVDDPGISTRTGQAQSRPTDPEARIRVIRLPGDARPDWLVANLKSGFRTLEADGTRVRVYLLADGSGRTIVVAQPTRIRDELAMNSSLLALIPILLLLPVMVLLVLRIVRTQLAPVSELAAHLDLQPAGRPLPLSDKNVPDEIMPFVHSLNRLLERVSELMNQQRRFIANAAHELRTPLTALSIQAQNLKQSGTLETMRERVPPLQAGIERAQKLTVQLLSLARTQAESPETSEVDVSAMARELIAEFLPMSEAKRIDLGLDEAAPLAFPASAETLRVVLRNALENALKYTPDGGEITLRLHSDASCHFIEVIDSGPGIPDDERERVFDPFYRLPGTAGEGSGLGLSIAREAAASLGGTINLLDRVDGPGLVFRYQQGR